MPHVCNGYHLPILSVLKDASRALLDKLGYESATFLQGRKFIFYEPLETCCPIDVLQASFYEEPIEPISDFASEPGVVHYEAYVQFSFYGKNADMVCNGFWQSISLDSENIEFINLGIQVLEKHAIRCNPQLIGKNKENGKGKAKEEWQDSFNFDLILLVPLIVKSTAEHTQYIASTGEVFALMNS